MQLFKQNTVVKQQSEDYQSRRFSTGQYLAAVGVMLLGVTAISYAAGLLDLTQFKSGTSISSSDVNANFQKIKDELNAMKTALVPAGTLIAYSGTTIPAGYKRCPTTVGEALVNRADYPALFSAIGVTWGAGDSVNTFYMPWFPEGYTLLQTNSVVGVQSVGQVITHTHTQPAGAGTSSGVNGTGGYLLNGAGVTGSTGGSANLAAGTTIMILVKI